MKFLGLVWSNLKRKKLRTTLTLLSIFVAFVLFAFSERAQACPRRRREYGGRGSAHRAPPGVVHPVAAASYQAAHRRGSRRRCSFRMQSWFGGIYKDPKNQFGTFPVEPEAFLAMNPELTLPEEQKQAWLKTRTGAIVGHAVSRTDSAGRSAIASR